LAIVYKGLYGSVDASKEPSFVDADNGFEFDTDGEQINISEKTAVLFSENYTFYTWVYIGT
jgi:hypothetical protein